MARGETPRSARPRRGPTLLWWAAYVALYLSFTGWMWTQLVTGMVAAAVAVALSRAALRPSGPSSLRSAPHVWRGRTIAVILLAEVRAVTSALLRQLRGRAPVEGRFVAFRVDEPIDAATDAGLTIEASLAPNTYVVAVEDDDRGSTVLVHQFAPRPRPKETFPRWRR